MNNDTTIRERLAYIIPRVRWAKDDNYDRNGVIVATLSDVCYISVSKSRNNGPARVSVDFKDKTVFDSTTNVQEMVEHAFDKFNAQQGSANDEFKSFITEYNPAD